MRYRSVYVYSKMIEADRAKNNVTELLWVIISGVSGRST